MKKHLAFLKILCYYQFKGSAEVLFMKDIKTIVAKNILFYRKQNKLSQKTLAEKIGVKHNTISSWESCTNSVDIDNLFKICDALNISVNEMLELDSKNAFKLNNSEKKLITAYREHPEMQAGINKMLDIEDKAEIRGEMRQMLKADKYQENHDKSKLIG